jgi:3-methyl-2-oxobutanoate hydroxymethyltransferase
MGGSTEGPRPTAAPAGAKTTVLTLHDKYRRGEPITMLTAYDFPTARALDEAGIDAILVGDSLAMVVLGHASTLTVTMDEMLHHARAVSRGAKRALLIGDLPFMSYQAERGEAIHNAGRFLQEGGMNAVKLEGGRAMAETVSAIVRAGIPVLGHIGLTPQSTNALGGYRVQGRTAGTARTLVEDALALEDSGCFGIVVEGVPERVATYLTERLSIPTIGIGAGAGVSGQVLVTHDLLGLYAELTPKFVKRYADLGQAMRTAFEAYRTEVASRAFPTREHAYAIAEDEWQSFLQTMRERGPRVALGKKRP